MRKFLEISDPTSCLNKAADNEPVFVLRAQDKIAPDTIRFWADLASLNGLPEDKYQEAMSLAEEMELWPNRKNPD